jgi:hypothetical protein
MNHLVLPIELEGLAGPEESVIVRTASTGVSLLATFNATLVAGRPFAEADLEPGREVAIVDQSFVRYVLGGGSAVGRRFREAASQEQGAEPGPWVEIVGVVGDLTAERHKNACEAVVYRPTPAGATHPLYVAVHVAGDTTPAMWRLRVLGAEVDQAIRLEEVQTLDQLRVADRVAIDFFLRLLGGIGVVALVLATAGVYALMAFTVSRRSTEIGIRLALGASSRRIVMTTFSRALAQVGLGVLVGSVPAVAIAASLGPEVGVSGSATTTAVICSLAAGAVAVVTLFACWVPARRALRIQPTDALKST